MSKLIREPGIILRCIRHGETSSILTVFTRGLGKIGLIAKGARRRIKKGSPLGLEIFTEAEFLYYYKNTRSLQLLKEIALTDAHLGLRDSLSGMTVASAILELLLRCLREEDPHVDLYDATCEALQELDSRQAITLPLLWKYEIILFQVLGFGLQLARCAVTNQTLHPPFKSGIRYRLRDGSFFAPDAKFAEFQDGTLSSESFAILSRLVSASYSFAGCLTVKQPVEREISLFLQHYLESHLPVSGRLRSLEALRWSRPIQS